MLLRTKSVFSDASSTPITTKNDFWMDDNNFDKSLCSTASSVSTNVNNTNVDSVGADRSLPNSLLAKISKTH